VQDSELYRHNPDERDALPDLARGHTGRVSHTDLHGYPDCWNRLLRPPLFPPAIGLIDVAKAAVSKIKPTMWKPSLIGFRFVLRKVAIRHVADHRHRPLATAAPI